MTIIEALGKLGITDLGNVDETVIKKAFRKMMKEVHPDLAGAESTDLAREVYEAKELLDSLDVNKELIMAQVGADVYYRIFKTITSLKNQHFEIDLESLIKLIDGEIADITTTTGKVFDMSQIRQMQTMVNFCINIKINGELNQYNVHRDLSRLYVNIEIGQEDKGYNKELIEQHLEIWICDSKRISFNAMKSNRVKLPIGERQIVVELYIEVAD